MPKILQEPKNNTRVDKRDTTGPNNNTKANKDTAKENGYKMIRWKRTQENASIFIILQIIRGFT
ncbi:hypothetical protein CA600_02485 [Paenibacillus sp. VTT E-133280]|nr:hypothetical protein CA600_02485 [Paenibacillus sp. VTT E-133280]